MAAYMGKDGEVSIAGETVAYMDTWTLNANIGTAEITDYEDDTKTFDSTLKEWTCTFAGTLDRSDTDQADLMDQFEDGTLADVAIRLETSAATYWGGNVRLTSMTVNSQVADKVSISWNAQGNGALSYT